MQPTLAEEPVDGRKEMSMVEGDKPAVRMPATDDEHRALGQRLREAREYLGLSQELVAEQLGVPRASVSAMETGRRKVSSLELKQLARLLKRPVSSFLDDAVEAEAPQDETYRALFRTARALSEEDRRQVLRFAQFLKEAGPAPTPPADETET